MHENGLCTCVAAALTAAVSVPVPALCAAPPVWAPGHRELFVDGSMVDGMKGVEFRLHAPQPREAAIVFDRPWEGNTSCYVTVFRDTDRFRMYFRGSNWDPATDRASGEYVCYAESRDGITWTRPELGLVEFEGSTANNILWNGPGRHNFTPFKDENPACPPDQRYKAVGGDRKGLLPFASADGIRWRLLRETPVITKGAFDSQNVVFWDPPRRKYVSFHRDFSNGKRNIRTCTSTDFINWTEAEWLDWGRELPIDLYTNAIVSCPRAPELLIGFPMRFIEARKHGQHRFGGVSDAGFMTSRDGRRWHLWDEAFIRPGLQASRWVNRNNMAARGVLVTASDRPGEPEELSIYSTEGYYVGPCILRRHTLRMDGFVSLHAGSASGEVTTRPFTLSPASDSSGTSDPPAPLLWTVNCSTSAAGSLRAEILDEQGQPLAGFATQILYGDDLDCPLRWEKDVTLRSLAGRTLRLRFHLQDADLYSVALAQE